MSLLRRWKWRFLVDKQAIYSTNFYLICMVTWTWLSIHNLGSLGLHQVGLEHGNGSYSSWFTEGVAWKVRSGASPVLARKMIRNYTIKNYFSSSISTFKWQQKKMQWLRKNGRVETGNLAMAMETVTTFVCVAELRIAMAPLNIVDKRDLWVWKEDTSSLHSVKLAYF